jgi:hypothetical protein
MFVFKKPRGHRGGSPGDLAGRCFPQMPNYVFRQKLELKYNFKTPEGDVFAIVSTIVTHALRRGENSTIVITKADLRLCKPTGVALCCI